MKENKKLDFSFWFSVFAIAISVVTLILFFVKVTPNSVIDISSFIGAIAAFIGISVTMVIGFQIYSVISIKDKLEAINLLKDELISANNELSITKQQFILLEKELKGIILLSESNINDKEHNYLEAFRKLQYAVVYFADIDTRKDILSAYINLMKEYSCNITQDELKQLGEFKISIYLTDIRDSHFKLKGRKYYWKIKDQYEKIYNELESKIVNQINSK